MLKNNDTQWNKCATPKLVMSSHLLFTTLGTLLITLRIEKKDYVLLL
jgi:hypothetical protein